MKKLLKKYSGIFKVLFLVIIFLIFKFFPDFSKNAVSKVISSFAKIKEERMKEELNEAEEAMDNFIEHMEETHTE